MQRLTLAQKSICLNGTAVSLMLFSSLVDDAKTGLRSSRLTIYRRCHSRIGVQQFHLGPYVGNFRPSTGLYPQHTHLCDIVGLEGSCH